MPILNLNILNGKFRQAKNVKILIAETWTELTHNQLCELLPLLAIPEEDLKEEYEKLALEIIIGEEYFKWIPLDRVGELIGHIEWIWNTPMTQLPFTKLYLSPKFVRYRSKGKYKYKELPFGKTCYVFPDENLYNVKVEEVIYGFAYLSVFFSNKKEEFLEKAMATFVRPAKKDWDKWDPGNESDEREPYHSGQCNERAELVFSKVDPKYKLLFLLFMMGCMQKISSAKNYEILFKESGGDGKKKKANPWSWRNFARACSSIEKLGGTLKDVHGQYFHDVLLEASQRAKEVKEENEEIQHQRALARVK